MNTFADQAMERQAAMEERMRVATESRVGWTFLFIRRAGVAGRRGFHFFDGANVSACGAVEVEADTPLCSAGHQASDVCGKCLEAYRARGKQPELFTTEHTKHTEGATDER